MTINSRQILLSRPLNLMLSVVMIAVLTSCDRTREDKGYEYFPDMAHSPSYKTYSPNPAMADGKTMRMPVEGTVPVDMVPYPYPAGEEGREQAGSLLSNPFGMDPQIAQQGDTIYNIFCTNCHGSKGDGMGNLFTTKKYIIPPASLISPDARDFSQGEIYHVITTGWGVMGAHGHLIKPEDRWKIISFIEVVFHDK